MLRFALVIKTPPNFFAKLARGNNGVLLTQVSNSSGTVAQTFTVDSFGNQTTSSCSLTNWFQYTGREFDTETSLYYYRARYYDQSSGRFVSEDPVHFKAGVNFYSYGLNDPVDNSDPSGQDAFVCLYPQAASRQGHIGFGFPGDPYTIGFYPVGPENGGRCTVCGQGRRLHGPGAV